MSVVTVEENYRIEIPQKVREKMYIKPGDKLEVLGGEKESCIVKKDGRSVAQETFGVLKNEIDGVEYMDKMRFCWERREP